ncbi:MAG: hypothetical protein WC371_05840 [Parachlamydiales bacterium]|jgi:hypothetical protein
METLFFQKLEFFLTLLEDRVETRKNAEILPLLKEMQKPAAAIGGKLLEHFLELEREAKRYLKDHKHLPALKHRALSLRNEFFEL